MTEAIGGMLGRLAVSALVAGALAFAPAAALAEETQATSEEQAAAAETTETEVEAATAADEETGAIEDGTLPDIDYANLTPEQLQQLIEEATTELVYRSEVAGDTEIATSDSTAAAELDLTVEQYELLINPSEDYVLERVSAANGVSEVMAATEDNDPNNKLHRQGGYTSDIFFKLDAVDHSQLVKQGDTLTEGTAGGGCVEVYATAEYAQRRDASLGAYDGTTLSNGSHHVYGTCVIRISEEITASQQAEAEAEILRVLTASQEEFDAQQTETANTSERSDISGRSSAEQTTAVTSDQDENAGSDEQRFETVAPAATDAASSLDGAGGTVETDLEELASRVATLEERVSALETGGSAATGYAGDADGEWKSMLGGDFLIGRDLPAGYITVRVTNDTSGYAMFETYADADALANGTYLSRERIDKEESFGAGLEDGMYLSVQIVSFGDETDGPTAEYSVQAFAVQDASTDQSA